MNEEQKVFSNREALCPNRKKFKVIEVVKDEFGYISELVVDVERNDQATVEGTKLTAEELNSIMDEIIKWKV